MIRSGNVRGAAEVVKTANAFANVCGSVCPEEIYCQSVCNRAKEDTPIAIRELHFHATQTEARSQYSRVRPFSTGKKSVAVIGGGPAGLSCAFELTKLGHRAVVYDMQGPGGVPRATIPPFRLDNAVLRSDLRFLTTFVSIVENRVDEKMFETIRNEHDAVFVAVGLGKDRPLGVPGEDLNGVVPVLQFLERAKWGSGDVKPGSKVIVVGGGNVSLDAAATAKRLGATDVTLVYRRGEKEMRVWKSELQEARAQGVDIRFLTNPVRVIGEKQVSGLECVRMILSGNVDASGRPVPVPVPGSEHVLPAETVVVAIGQEIPEGAFPSLRRAPKGYVDVGRNFATSLKGVFAGGDLINGEGTIVLSVAHGKEAARSIHDYLTESPS
jgi:glutamate synthase (NADPH/NADH) small chain